MARTGNNYETWLRGDNYINIQGRCMVIGSLPLIAIYLYTKFYLNANSSFKVICRIDGQSGDYMLPPLGSIIKVLSSPIRNYLKTTLIKHTMWRTQLTRGSTSLIQSLRCCTLDLSILTCITTLSNTFNVTLPHCWTFACNTKTICVNFYL